MTAPYGTTVLDHFRRPRNRRALESATVSREGFNPLCGDRVRIELEIVSSRVHDAAFTANACAICTASASLLTERIRGRDVDDVRRLTDDDVLDALGTELPVARVRCATLPAQTLREALASMQHTA
jgi:nitrogen fixation protein NifU and related proteins